MDITLYDIGQRFIGLREVKGHATNPAIMAMLQLDHKWPQDDEVPWCSAALNWWAWLLRLPRSKSLLARSWLGVGIPLELFEATVGFDVVVLKRQEDDPGPEDTSAPGHVTLFAGWDGDHVLGLGGNQADAVGIAPYPRGRILGIRRLYSA